MAVMMGGSSVVLPKMPGGRPSVTRKIALLGSHSDSLKNAPWFDPTWELWGHSSCRAWYRRELDRYFDLHPEACWTRVNRKGSTYMNWLRSNTVDIYMQERHPEVPASIRYPKERVLMEFGGIRRYFKNHMAWMSALALSEGVTTLALFGINYGHVSEYEMQRGSAEYWLGVLEGRGVRVILPDECTLLAEPKGLYGYESHDEEGKLRESYKRRIPHPAETIRPILPGEVVTLAKPPAHLLDQIALDEMTRPEWAKIPLPNRTDGEATNV